MHARFALLALPLLACPSGPRDEKSSASPEAGAAGIAARDAGPAPADAASPDARPAAATLVIPESGRAPTRTKHAAPDGARALLDCNWHGVWNEPAGWRVTEVDGEQIAWNADRTAAIVRARAPEKDLAAARAIAARLAGAEVAFGEPVLHRKNKWSTRTELRGTATRGGAELDVRVEQHWRGFRKDLVWVQVAAGPGRGAAMAEMDAARTGALLLVDHACECKYDCWRRP